MIHPLSCVAVVCLVALVDNTNTGLLGAVTEDTTQTTGYHSTLLTSNVLIIQVSITRECSPFSNLLSVVEAFSHSIGVDSSQIIIRPQSCEASIDGKGIWEVDFLVRGLQTREAQEIVSSIHSPDSEILTILQHALGFPLQWTATVTRPEAEVFPQYHKMQKQGMQLPSAESSESSEEDVPPYEVCSLGVEKGNACNYDVEYVGGTPIFTIYNWYYDANTRSCKQFQTGCNENHNRFASRHKCQTACVRDPEYALVSSIILDCTYNTDTCETPPDEHTLRAFFLKALMTELDDKAFSFEISIKVGECTTVFVQPTSNLPNNQNNNYKLSNSRFTLQGTDSVEWEVDVHVDTKLDTTHTNDMEKLNKAEQLVKNIQTKDSAIHNIILSDSGLQYNPDTDVKVIKEVFSDLDSDQDDKSVHPDEDGDDNDNDADDKDDTDNDKDDKDNEDDTDDEGDSDDNDDSDDKGGSDDKDDKDQDNNNDDEGDDDDSNEDDDDDNTDSAGEVSPAAPVNCGPLQDSNGVWTTTPNTLVEATATLNCAGGHELSASGVSTRTCGSDGQWSGSPATCVEEPINIVTVSATIQSVDDPCTKIEENDQYTVNKCTPEEVTTASHSSRFRKFTIQQDVKTWKITIELIFEKATQSVNDVFEAVSTALKSTFGEENVSEIKQEQGSAGTPPSSSTVPSVSTPTPSQGNNNAPTATNAPSINRGAAEEEDDGSPIIIVAILVPVLIIVIVIVVIVVVCCLRRRKNKFETVDGGKRDNSEEQAIAAQFESAPKPAHLAEHGRPQGQGPAQQPGAHPEGIAVESVGGASADEGFSGMGPGGGAHHNPLETLDSGPGGAMQK